MHDPGMLVHSCRWDNSDASTAHAYLLPAVTTAVKEIRGGQKLRILDLGCGNGYIAGGLAEMGHEVIGIDASPDGIEIARRAHPSVKFYTRSLYDGLGDLVATSFDCVVALEVIEHLYYPRRLLQESHTALRLSGRLIVSTPYHGFLKNLAISLVNGWDLHFGPGWDGGHIKFFSPRTLSAMAQEAGLHVIRVQGVGRAPFLWKSMIMVAERRQPS